ncbi:hypothetical protein VP01_83g3 [Puccinia sorghi]|uniref:Uncharacterized protein n=1 Tax=Puccinia sorghi TaxID=27349 RepID=A0A0L6UBI9_9BASI|nr:hypothetical protein VP01_83g3 [Puccinia sorghi]
MQSINLWSCGKQIQSNSHLFPTWPKPTWWYQPCSMQMCLLSWIESIMALYMSLLSVRLTYPQLSQLTDSPFLHCPSLSQQCALLTPSTPHSKISNPPLTSPRTKKKMAQYRIGKGLVHYPTQPGTQLDIVGYAGVGFTSNQINATKKLNFSDSSNNVCGRALKAWSQNGTGQHRSSSSSQRNSWVNFQNPQKIGSFWALTWMGVLVLLWSNQFWIFFDPQKINKQNVKIQALKNKLKMTQMHIEILSGSPIFFSQPIFPQINFALGNNSDNATPSNFPIDLSKLFYRQIYFSSQKLIDVVKFDNQTNQNTPIRVNRLVHTSNFFQALACKCFLLTFSNTELIPVVYWLQFLHKFSLILVSLVSCSVMFKSYQILHQNKKPLAMIQSHCEFWWQDTSCGSSLTFQQTQRPKLDTVELEDLKKGLGESNIRSGSSSGEEKEMFVCYRPLTCPNQVECGDAKPNQVIKNMQRFSWLPNFYLWEIFVSFPVGTEWCLTDDCFHSFYPYSQCDHNIKKEYQGHEMVAISDMSDDNFKTENKSWSMNHIIFLMIFHNPLEFKFNFKKNWMRKRTSGCFLSLIPTQGTNVFELTCEALKTNILGFIQENDMKALSCKRHGKITGETNIISKVDFSCEGHHLGLNQVTLKSSGRYMKGLNIVQNLMRDSHTLTSEWKFIPIHSIQEKRLNLMVKYTRALYEYSPPTHTTLFSYFTPPGILVRSLKLPHLRLPLLIIKYAFQLFLQYISYYPKHTTLLVSPLPQNSWLGSGGVQVFIYLTLNLNLTKLEEFFFSISLFKLKIGWTSYVSSSACKFITLPGFQFPNCKLTLFEPLSHLLSYTIIMNSLVINPPDFNSLVSLLFLCIHPLLLSPDSRDFCYPKFEFNRHLNLLHGLMIGNFQNPKPLGKKKFCDHLELPNGPFLSVDKQEQRQGFLVTLHMNCFQLYLIFSEIRLNPISQYYNNDRKKSQTPLQNNFICHLTCQNGSFKFNTLKNIHSGSGEVILVNKLRAIRWNYKNTHCDRRITLRGDNWEEGNIRGIRHFRCRKVRRARRNFNGTPSRRWFQGFHRSVCFASAGGANKELGAGERWERNKESYIASPEVIQGYSSCGKPHFGATRGTSRGLIACFSEPRLEQKRKIVIAAQVLFGGFRPGGKRRAGGNLRKQLHVLLSFAASMKGALSSCSAVWNHLQAMVAERDEIHVLQRPLCCHRLNRYSISLSTHGGSLECVYSLILGRQIPDSMSRITFWQSSIHHNALDRFVGSNIGCGVSIGKIRAALRYSVHPTFTLFLGSVSNPFHDCNSSADSYLNYASFPACSRFLTLGFSTKVSFGKMLGPMSRILPSSCANLEATAAWPNCSDRHNMSGKKNRPAGSSFHLKPAVPTNVSGNELCIICGEANQHEIEHAWRSAGFCRYPSSCLEDYYHCISCCPAFCLQIASGTPAVFLAMVSLHAIPKAPKSVFPIRGGFSGALESTDGVGPLSRTRLSGERMSKQADRLKTLSAFVDSVYRPVKTSRDKSSRRSDAESNSRTTVREKDGLEKLQHGESGWGQTRGSKWNITGETVVKITTCHKCETSLFSSIIPPLSPFPPSLSGEILPPSHLSTLLWPLINFTLACPSFIFPSPNILPYSTPVSADLNIKTSLTVTAVASTLHLHHGNLTPPQLIMNYEDWTRASGLFFIDLNGALMTHRILVCQVHNDLLGLLSVNKCTQIFPVYTLFLCCGNDSCAAQWTWFYVHKPSF